METKQHFNKRMVARVRRILKETEQYKAELLHYLCEQNGFVIRGNNNNRLVNSEYMLNRVEVEDIPYTFKYSADKTYVFGDLLVRLNESWGASYFTVSLKPPVFDLENYDPHHLDLETFLSLLEER
jgi:hypothetical protein